MDTSLPALRIDREALVARHKVVLTEANPEHVLTVGNGDFAFSVDATGMQTFTQFHDQSAAMARSHERAAGDANPMAAMFADPPVVNTATMSNWGWHEMPNPENYVLDDAMTDYETARGRVSYPDRYATTPTGEVVDEFKAGAWLHVNPQRLDLGRVGLMLRESADGIALTDIGTLVETNQSLDLWTGTIESTFTFLGEPVRVVTVAAPDTDAVAFSISSPLLADGRLAVAFQFPYASAEFFDPADWNADDRHTSTLTAPGNGQATIYRQLDESRYVVDAQFSSGTVRQAGQHRFELATDAEVLHLVVQFAPDAGSLADVGGFDEVRVRSTEEWRDFWNAGAAIEFDAEGDDRAFELERRVVLSQYLTKVNSSGTLPPQETGLITNSWQGKFHLEMHFWHAAHFAVWGRPELLERSLPWYLSILGEARRTAKRQGYPGVRWPKQVGPDGRESPSDIGSLLIWQQPHILYMLELAWTAASADHRAELLADYGELVYETAVFMAAFPEEREGVFHLGPPVMPAQEFYDARATEDPTFELAYWWLGLEIAQRWQERSGKVRRPDWTNVQECLARPHVQGGRYSAIATEPYLRRDDHPSLLAALGVVPPTPLIEPAIMAATMRHVIDTWEWDSAWGWDFPVVAMTAARLGDAELATDILTRAAFKNRFSVVGHSPQMSSLLPIYLPSNGSLLAAVSLLATAGENGTPLFPGSWTVSAEGFIPWPA